MYSNSYCSYKFAPKQEKIGQSSHKEYSNNILKYLEFTAIINACTKKVWKLFECTSYVIFKLQPHYNCCLFVLLVLAAASHPQPTSHLRSAMRKYSFLVDDHKV